MKADIRRLLYRAQYCHEHGQNRMARRALDTAVERLGGSESMGKWDDDVYELVTHLDEFINDELNVAPDDSAEDVPSDQVKCKKCDATGIYAKTGRVCYDCEGKGFMTVEDRRRVKQFESRRLTKIEAARNQYVDQEF